MKQGDLASRTTTAILIDELSLGVTLTSEEVRISTEIAYFMHKASGITELHPLRHLVWCKLSYVLGIRHPGKTGFDPETELALQKSFFDHMWTIPLREMVTMIGDAAMPDADFGDVAATLNEGIAAHTREVRSFANVYASEVRGVVDLAGATAVDIMMSMARKKGVNLEAPTPQQRKDSERQYKNLLVLALERNRARDSLRTMHILACLHASLRWNKGQKFDGNDIFDFHHAAAALAHCDAFFTERPLCTMVTQSHVALDKLFGCNVVCRIEDAVSWLKNLP